MPDKLIAATITTASDELSRMQDSTLADHEIKFVTPTGVDASGDTITIAFESTYALGTFALLDFDLADGSTNNCTSATFTEKTLATSAAAGVWGVATSGQVVTFTPPTDASSGEITADRCVRIEIGSNATEGGAGSTVMTNPTSAGAFTVTIAGSFGDSGIMATNIVVDDTIDVTAIVATTISCAVDNTTTDFGTFVVDTIDTASNVITWTISTNATNGYNLTVRDTGNGSPGLYSAGASYLLASATADLGAVSLGYGLQGSVTYNGDAGSASTTIESPYASGTDNVGGLLIADTKLAGATGPVAATTVASTLKALVSGLVPAGDDYADTLTYICTGIY